MTLGPKRAREAGLNLRDPPGSSVRRRGAGNHGTVSCSCVVSRHHCLVGGPAALHGDGRSSAFAALTRGYAYSVGRDDSAAPSRPDRHCRPSKLAASAAFLGSAHSSTSGGLSRRSDEGLIMVAAEDNSPNGHLESTRRRQVTQGHSAPMGTLRVSALHPDHRTLGSADEERTVRAGMCRVSILDERYQWNASPIRRATSRDGPISSNSGSNASTALLDGLRLRGRFEASVHRSFASNMIRAVLSMVTSPLLATWGEGRSRDANPTHYSDSRHRRGSTRFLMVQQASFASDSAYPEALEYHVSRFMERLKRSVTLEDLEDLEGPILHVFSRGGLLEAADVIPQAWADPYGASLPLQRLSEARNLRNSLEQHAVKWTYRGTKGSGDFGVSACLGKETLTASRKKTGSSTGKFAAESSTNSAELHTLNGKECCICLSRFEEGEVLLTLRCLHIFHANCLDRWIETSHSVKCPLCSTEIAQPHGEAHDGSHV